DHSPRHEERDTRGRQRSVIRRRTIRFDGETSNPIPKPILRGTTLQSSQLASPFYPSPNTWAAVMSSRFGADVLTLHDRDETIEGIIRFLKTHSERRSEEHTSELQSRFDLVCRLLLEKKK